MKFVHGVDLIEVSRIKRMLEEHGDSFLSRCFTDTERAVSNVSSDETRNQRFATRFAAKEAVMKALGTGWGNGVGWKDVSVESVDGPPQVRLAGGAERRATELGITQWALSLSHTESHAIASVIGTGASDA
ncbi:MAG: holo-ACP synthase [Phycisphaerales bacterium]|nr:holo-ACP synthase [Phycisphaerales bacterium]